MSQPDRSRLLPTILASLGVMALVAIIVIVLVPRLVERTFEITVDVLLCGSPIDLEIVEPQDVPPGCIDIPIGIDLSMRNPGIEANLYDNGWFGFRDIEEGSYDTTLVVSGAIDSSDIAVVTYDDDGSRRTGQFGPAETQGEWSVDLTIDSGDSRMLIILTNSPETPSNIA